MSAYSLYERSSSTAPTSLKLYSEDDNCPHESERRSDSRVPANAIWNSPQFAESSQLQPPESLKHRTTGSVLYLGDALQRIRTEFSTTRRDDSWSQYETLVSRWEEHFDGTGPAVSEIADSHLEEFFYGQEDWAAEATWKRYYSQLLAILKSCCPRSSANPMGLPRDVESPLRLDSLPALMVPDAEWFKENRSRLPMRGGHTPKLRSTLPLEQFQRVIDACWTVRLQLGDAIWWETLFGWLWFSGMRICQARKKLRWCEDGQSDGIHLQSRTVVTNETKKHGLIIIPLPVALLHGLHVLHDRPKARRKRNRTLKFGDIGYEAYVFRETGLVANTPFYQQYRAIWDAAIPVKDEAERELKHFLPHELRSVSITTWDMLPEPDCKAGWLVTGHSPGDERTRKYFRPGDDRLRPIVDRFPMPMLHAATSGRMRQPRLFD